MPGKRMSLQEAMRISGMTEPPAEDWVRRFLIESTENLIERHGEAWVVKNQKRLRAEIEFFYAGSKLFNRGLQTWKRYSATSKA